MTKALLLTRDLISSQKFKTVAKELSVDFIVYREASDFFAALNEPFSLGLIDLYTPNLNFAAFNTLSDQQKRKITGICSHIDKAMAEKAKTTGISIIPRSKFSRDLNEILTRHGDTRTP